MSSRSLSDLHPKVHRMANALLTNCSVSNIELIVTCTFRSAEEQASLYAWGRGTDIRPVITRAAPGRSYHQYGLAIDVVPIANGKPEWSVKSPLWMKVGMIGEAVGFEWAGRWRVNREFPHFQWTGGLSIEDLLAGKRVPEDA